MPLLTAVSYFAEDLAALFCVGAVLRFVLLRRFRLRPAAFALTVCIVVNAALGAYLSAGSILYLALTDVLSFLLRTATLFALFPGKKKGQLILTTVLFDVTIEMLYSLFAAYLGDAIWIESLFGLAAYAVIGAAVWLLESKRAVAFLPQVISGVPKWVWAALILFELTCYYREFGLSIAWYRALYIVSTAAIVFTLLYVVGRLVWLVYRQNQMSERLQRQRAFAETVADNDETLRRFRHDYNNHMSVINALLAAGKTAQAQEYLARLSSSVAPAMQRIATGNFIADALLDQTARTAREKDIAVTFSGSIPSAGIDDTDLCTVLSNLLDNAVEAAEKTGDRQKVISVSAGSRDGTFFMRVTNPTENVSGSTETTKADRRSHGIGLKNVRRTVERRDGALVTSAEGRIFSAEITMRMDPPPGTEKTAQPVGEG